MRYNLICSDPPWNFKDKLTMSSVKRGAKSNYKVLSDQDIINLPVEKIAAKDSLLALWVPSSKLQVGLDCMKAWGYTQKQTFIWVKTKKKPLDNFKKQFMKNWKKFEKDGNYIGLFAKITKSILDQTQFSLQDILYFGMGRLFRQTHELVLIGTRGKIYNHLKNKSQRSVHFWPVGKHSEKPEGLQDMLDLMFSEFKTKNKLEMFARRDREGWTTVGLECPTSFGEDIHDSIERLYKLK